MEKVCAPAAIQASNEGPQAVGRIAPLKARGRQSAIPADDRVPMKYIQIYYSRKLSKAQILLVNLSV